MSNLGLERFLEGKGLRLERTGVGDRYVVERMRQGGFNLGGEQSGHIVMTDYATTGDGLLAGVQFLAAMAETGHKASELARNFETVPQMLKNVRFRPGKRRLRRRASRMRLPPQRRLLPVRDGFLFANPARSRSCG